MNVKKAKLTQAEYRQIYDDAVAAGNGVTSEMVEKNPGVWYPCGFAWAVIKPARGPFVKFLKENKLGMTSELGGYRISPISHSTQWMDARYAGVKAFVEELAAHGIKATAHQRID